MSANGGGEKRKGHNKSGRSQTPGPTRSGNPRERSNSTGESQPRADPPRVVITPPSQEKPEPAKDPGARPKAKAVITAQHPLVPAPPNPPPLPQQPPASNPAPKPQRQQSVNSEKQPPKQQQVLIAEPKPQRSQSKQKEPQPKQPQHHHHDKSAHQKLLQAHGETVQQLVGPLQHAHKYECEFSDRHGKLYLTIQVPILGQPAVGGGGVAERFMFAVGLKALCHDLSKAGINPNVEPADAAFHSTYASLRKLADRYDTKHNGQVSHGKSSQNSKSRGAVVGQASDRAEDVSASSPRDRARSISPRPTRATKHSSATYLGASGRLIPYETHKWHPGSIPDELPSERPKAVSDVELDDYTMLRIEVSNWLATFHRAHVDRKRQTSVTVNVGGVQTDRSVPVLTDISQQAYQLEVSGAYAGFIERAKQLKSSIMTALIKSAFTAIAVAVQAQFPTIRFNPSQKRGRSKSRDKGEDTVDQTAEAPEAPRCATCNTLMPNGTCPICK